MRPKVLDADRERGTMAVELALLTPVLVLLLMLVVAGGRVVTTRGDVEGSARDAARAATLSRNSPSVDATNAAKATLGGLGLSCVGGPQVRIVPQTPLPGDTVTATVTCTVRLSDLGLPGLGGTRDVTQSVKAPVDAYRGQ